MSNAYAVEVPEIYKVQEIMQLLGALKEAAHKLPEGNDRRDALREIRDFQLRAAALVRRLVSAA